MDEPIEHEMYEVNTGDAEEWRLEENVKLVDKYLEEEKFIKLPIS